MSGVQTIGMVACIYALGMTIGYMAGEANGRREGRADERGLIDNEWTRSREMQMCRLPAEIYKGVKCYGREP